MTKRLEVWYHTLVAFDFDTGKTSVVKSFTTLPKEQKTEERLETKETGVVEL